MQELRYVTSEDGFLILDNAAGERFKVLISDSLREGSRQLISSARSNPTSPKQIQTLYRSGKSEDQIAAETGESIEYIQMFTPAVQSELDYVTERIQGTEFVFGNRMMSFADIVEMSFQSAIWQSYKVGGTWFVKVAQGPVAASWRYDPKLNLLEPQNDLAKKISSGMQDARPVEIESNVTSAELPTQSQPAEQIPLPIVDLEQPEPTQDAEVFSLLDEIRERRLASEKPKPEISEQASPQPKQPATSPKPVSAKGRTSLPSWDEIIFGSNFDA